MKNNRFLIAIVGTCLCTLTICRAAKPGDLLWRFIPDQRGGGFGDNAPSVPALDSAGTIYFRSPSDGRLYAINPDGTRKWVFQPDGTAAFQASPSIGNDGTIYLACDDGSLYAVTSDGARRWTSPLAFNFSNRPYLISPALGEDGTIYVGYYQRWKTFSEECQENSAPSLPTDQGGGSFPNPA